MYITKEPLSGNFKSKFILIKDNTNASGVKLLKAVLNTLLKESVKLQIIYYESTNINLLSEQHAGNDNIVEINAASDPLGWNNAEKSSDNFRSLKALSQICCSHKGVICLDSMSPLLFHNDANSVYKVLHKSLKENEDLQIIALMHADVHNAVANAIIEKLASTVLSVASADDKCLCTVHYSSGKVSNQLLEYGVSDKFELCMMREFHQQVTPTASKQPDPTANLTFNLRLRDNEIEARSQLQLPYMQMQNKDVIEADIDMYDEEDPDDDLDI